MRQKSTIPSPFIGKTRKYIKQKLYKKYNTKFIDNENTLQVNSKTIFIFNNDKCIEIKSLCSKCKKHKDASYLQTIGACYCSECRNAKHHEYKQQIKEGRTKSRKEEIRILKLYKMYKPAERECLMCGKKFLSLTFHNRRCPTCEELLTQEEFNINTTIYRSRAEISL